MTFSAMDWRLLRRNTVACFYLVGIYTVVYNSEQAFTRVHYCKDADKSSPCSLVESIGSNKILSDFLLVMLDIKFSSSDVHSDLVSTFRLTLHKPDNILAAIEHTSININVATYLNW